MRFGLGSGVLGVAGFMMLAVGVQAQRTQKPPLHGNHWMAVTGRPLAAEAGAQIFQKGGNAIDAACAMLGAVCTMHIVLTWGGETQALIYNPHTGKVIAINALGYAPTGATPAFFKSKGYDFPPEYGPLAAVTPGTPVSEQYLLDLEREAFLSLCGEKKTQERIAFTLKTGKPLRN